MTTRHIFGHLFEMRRVSAGIHSRNPAERGDGDNEDGQVPAVLRARRGSFTAQDPARDNSRIRVWCESILRARLRQFSGEGAWQKHPEWFPRHFRLDPRWLRGWRGAKSL